MKTLFFCVVLVSASLPALPQQVRPGIKGGLNLANEKIQSDPFSRKGTTIASFHAGFLLDIPLSESFYVQPQLLLSGKGSKDGSLIYRPYYVELPVNILYKYEVNDALKIYGGLGPGIGLGILGNVKSVNGNFDRKLKFGETTDADYKTVDFTGGFELGAELNSKVGLGIGYRWSFLDVTRGSARVTHKIVNFSLAYFFGGDGGKSKTANKQTGSRRRSKRN
jgi:hypothetical protein